MDGFPSLIFIYKVFLLDCLYGSELTLQEFRSIIPTGDDGAQLQYSDCELDHGSHLASSPPTLLLFTTSLSPVTTTITLRLHLRYVGQMIEIIMDLIKTNSDYLSVIGEHIT
jgi:hypothetical protein